VHVLPRSVDIVHQGINRRIGIRQQSPCIAGNGGETANRVTKLKQVAVYLRHLGSEIRSVGRTSIESAFH
jgi:hypothetical protein